MASNSKKIHPTQDFKPEDLKEKVIKSLKKIADKKNSQTRVNAEIISLWNFLKANDPENFITNSRFKPTKKIEDVKKQVAQYIIATEEQEEMLRGRKQDAAALNNFKPYLKIMFALCKINEELSNSRPKGIRRMLNIAYSALALIPNIMENFTISMINGDYISLRVKTPTEKKAIDNFNTTTNKIITTINFKPEKEQPPKRPVISNALRQAYKGSITKKEKQQKEYTNNMLEFLKNDGAYRVHERDALIVKEMHKKHGIKFN